MNWLSRLDEIVTNLLPEEDRRDAKNLRRGNGTTMRIDALLDMDLNYGAEEDVDEMEASNVDEQTNQLGSDLSHASVESTASLGESMDYCPSISDPTAQGSQEGAASGSYGDLGLTTPITSSGSIPQPEGTPSFVTPKTSPVPEVHENEQRKETPYFRTPETFRSSPYATLTPTTSVAVESDLNPSETTSSVRPSPIGTTAEIHTTLPPRNINVMEQDISDIDLDVPLPDWNSSDILFHPSMNCPGVVHVRALAAQRLPCPVGSTVQLAVTLLPWNGKVRGEPTISFGKNSVWVKWDALSEATGCSMVHPWNNQDTPVPTIKMELLFKPMKLLEFKMCSLELSCQPLLTQPGVWKKQWCQTTVPSNEQQPASLADHTPLILIEAAFFPASHDDDEEEEVEKDDEISFLENTTSGAPSIRHDDGSSLRSARFLRGKNRPHLLKLHSVWRPADCAVCKRSLIGWKRAYRCEACNIDCCGDCQLQIDLQIPCGSSLAKNAVETSIQSKMTIENMLATIAPVDEKYSKQVWDQPQDSKKTGKAYHEGIPSETRRIGKFRIQVIQAFVFETPLPIETDPSTVFDESIRTNLRRGDYYARVSCLGGAAFNRTRTIQNTATPKFDETEMVFGIPHYGMEYRVDVLDAFSNTSVGTMLVTAQSLLQLYRDRRVERDGIEPFLPCVRRSRTCMPIRQKVELRVGFKDGFGLDYFVPYKARSANRNGPKPGAISGWIMVEMSIDEDLDTLFGQSPTKCPPRPPHKLDMELLHNHINRITMIVKDVKSAINLYLYVVSWKNPPLTGLSLVVFLRVCCKFDTEYIASLPILMLILMMLYLAAARKAGRLKERFIRREMESRASLAVESSLDRPLHRPLGFIQLSVPKGRNLRSRDLGLPGSVGCHVFWHPQRYCADEDAIKMLSSTDRLLSSHHDIGDTNYLYTANPDWKTLKESNHCKRLRQITTSETGAEQIGENDRNHDYLELPVPQPIQNHADIANGADASQTNISLSPWTTLPGAIVIQVRFADVINVLPGFEEILGEVAIPISKVTQKGEYRGWFQVVEAGSRHFVRCDENDGAGTPRIFVDLKWKGPVSTDDHLTDSDREASIMVTEEMVRAALRNSKNRHDIIGSSMGALNTFRGLGETVQTIQNTLGNAVDVIERVRNLLNFTDPGLSSLLLFGLSIIWVFLTLTPTRVLFLLSVIVQYGGAFVSRFGPALIDCGILGQPKESLPSRGDKEAAAPLAVWLSNAFDSIPTDDDLQKAYFWESARISDIERSKLATMRRVSRLEQLWNAKWYSALKIRETRSSKGAVPSRCWSWETRFGVVHGRRLLIWSTEISFDNGDPPMDRVILSGHAGLAGLSPLDVRELSSDEVSRVANIFGRGIHGQVKLMLLLPDESSKETLEETILAAALKDD